MVCNYSLHYSNLTLGANSVDHTAEDTLPMALLRKKFNLFFFLNFDSQDEEAEDITEMVALL